MGFVDYDAIISVEEFIILRFRQQNSIRHEFNPAVIRIAIVKANLKTNLLAQFNIQLFRHPLSHRTRSNPSWLSTGNRTFVTKSCEQTHFRQLCGLTRTGFTGNHHDLIVLNRFNDFILTSRNRQIFCQFHLGFGS